MLFPACAPASSTDTAINWPCVEAGLSSFDKNCAVCTASSSTQCHYPPAFVYEPGTPTGDNYCPAGVTADNLARFLSLEGFVDEPDFTRLTDEVPPS